MSIMGDVVEVFVVLSMKIVQSIEHSRLLSWASSLLTKLDIYCPEFRLAFHEVSALTQKGRYNSVLTSRDQP